MSSIRLPISKDQRGLISIVVTVVLILVISLLVLSYAKVIRREQNIQLDRQLSSRAFYAAESGVNLAQEKIVQLNRTTNKPDCGYEISGNGTGSNKIAEDDLKLDENTQITCLTIDQTPTTIELASVSSESRVVLLRPASGDIDSLKISWRAETPPSVDGCSDSSDAFPTGAAGQEWNCGHPLLRIDLVPVGSNSGFNRNDLINDLFTAFLYPLDAGASSYAVTTAKGAQKGSVLSADCSTGVCSATITGLNGAGNFYNEYMLRVISLYGDSTLVLEPLDVSSAVELADEQAVIDSTAVASGVSRRIQVRIPISEGRGTVPDFAILNAGDLCKQYSVASGVGFLVDNCTP